MSNTQRNFWDATYQSDELENSELGTLIRNQRRQRKDILKQCLPNISDSIILEAGCGRGEDLLSLYEPGRFLVGLDYSLNAIKICLKMQKKLNFDSSFVLGDVLQLPFRGDIFDLVFNAGVVEHFTDTYAPLKEMVRVVVPGRSVAVFVPNMFSFWVGYKHTINLLSKVTKKIKGWGIWEKSFNFYDLKKIGRLLGLEGIKVKGIHLMHYYHVILIIEQLAKSKAPKSFTYRIFNFLAKLDQKPSFLSVGLGMELVLIGKKPENS